MAALSGLGVDNAVVKVSGGRVGELLILAAAVLLDLLLRIAEIGERRELVAEAQLLRHVLLGDIAPVGTVARQRIDVDRLSFRAALF